GVIGTTLLMAVAFELAVFGWFAHAIEVYTGTPEIVALVLLVVMAPLLQPQLLALALARHVAPRPRAAGGGGPLAGAVAWVGTEWACPKLFGDTLGYGLWPCAWMRQAADVAGVPGLTLALLLGNECALAAARALAGAEPRRALVPTAGLATLVLALSGDGALRERTFAAHPAGDASVRASIVQADIARYGPLASRQGPLGAAGYLRGGAHHAGGVLRALRQAPAAVAARPHRLAGDGLPDDVRLSEERRGRGVRPRHRAVRRAQRRSARLRCVRRRGRSGVQRGRLPRAGGPRSARVRDLPQGVPLSAHRTRAGHARRRARSPLAAVDGDLGAGGWGRGGGGAAAGRPHAARGALDLLRRPRSCAGVASRARRRGDDRHPVARRLVLGRPRALAASRRRGVPQRRDPTSPGARHQHGDLRRGRRQRCRHRPRGLRPAGGARRDAGTGGARDDARAALGRLARSSVRGARR